VGFGHGAGIIVPEPRIHSEITYFGRDFSYNGDNTGNTSAFLAQDVCNSGTLEATLSGTPISGIFFHLIFFLYGLLEQPILSLSSKDIN
jgi:hypothetical protein